MNKCPKTRLFKTIAIFLILIFSWNNFAYTAARDLKACLAVWNKSNKPLAMIDIDGSPVTIGGFIPANVVPLLFGIIASALRDEALIKNVTEEDIKNLIRQLLGGILDTEALKNIDWKNLRKQNKNFYLPIKFNEKKIYELKFSHSNGDEKKNTELLLNFNNVCIEIVDFSASGTIDPLIKEAFSGALSQLQDITIGTDSGKKLTVSVNSSNVKYPKEKAEITPFLSASDICEDDADKVGMKAALLAGFEKFLKKRGVVSDIADRLNVIVRIPLWFVIPGKAVNKITFLNFFREEYRQELNQKFAEISEGKDKEFGNSERPLFVCVRDSNLTLNPGQFISFRNIGLNDDTVQILGIAIGDQESAFQNYAELIRDFAMYTKGVSAEAFDRNILLKKFSIQMNETDGEWLVRVYKEVYEEQAKQPFPQDSYEQLILAIFGAAFFQHASENSIIELSKANSVIVEEMSYGKPPSFSSVVATSRNPQTGEKIPQIEQSDHFSDNIHSAISEILLLAEEFIGDMAYIEFVAEEYKSSRHVLALLQVERSLCSVAARAKTLHSLVKNGIIQKEDLYTCIIGLKLEGLKYALEQDIPEDAMYVTQGKLIAPGRVCGVVVFGEEKARFYEQKGIPAILVAPVINVAVDSEAIRISSGVIAVEKMGAHARGVALKYGIPVVAEVENGSFQENTDKIIIGEKDNVVELEEGKTILLIMPNGKIYYRNMQTENFKQDHSSKRKKYLEEFIVETMCWQMEAQGQEPKLLVDKKGSGIFWGKTIQEEVSMEKYDQLKKQKRYDGVPVLIGVYDVFAANSISKNKALIEKREISKRTLEYLIREVVSLQDEISQYTYMLWKIYDDFVEKVADKEKIALVNSERKIVYTNLEEMRKRFIVTLSEESPEAFVRAVFYGVGRHKMSRFIFRSFILDYLEVPKARAFFKRVIKYGAQHGYRGDDRGFDFQMARLFSHFACEDQAFAAEVLTELNEKELRVLLGELDTFYLVRNFRTKARDSGFATYDQMRIVLNVTAALVKFDDKNDFMSISKEFRKGLDNRIYQLDESKDKVELVTTGIKETTLSDLLKFIQSGTIGACSVELKKILPLESDMVRPRAFILYADDIIDYGAIFDLESTLKISNGQRRVLENDEIILYVTKRKKNSDEIIALQRLIKIADHTINISIISKDDLNGKVKTISDEMIALKNFTKNQLIRRMDGTEPEADQYLGIVSGSIGNCSDVVAVSKALQMPTIIFKSPGVYSFGEAVHAVFSTWKNMASEKIVWFRYLDPAKALDVGELKKEFDLYIRAILIKA